MEHGKKLVKWPMYVFKGIWSEALSKAGELASVIGIKDTSSEDRWEWQRKLKIEIGSRISCKGFEVSSLGNWVELEAA